MSKLGKRLEQLLNESDILYKDFAKIMHVKPPTVTNWVKGKRFPEEMMLLKIADFFHVSLDYLLGRTDIPNAAVYENKIHGHDVHIEYKKETYPDGLTHEQVVGILKNLKKAGFKFDPDKKPE